MGEFLLWVALVVGFVVWVNLFVNDVQVIELFDFDKNKRI